MTTIVASREQLSVTEPVAGEIPALTPEMLEFEEQHAFLHDDDLGLYAVFQTVGEASDEAVKIAAETLRGYWATTGREIEGYEGPQHMKDALDKVYSVLSERFYESGIDPRTIIRGITAVQFRDDKYMGLMLTYGTSGDQPGSTLDTVSAYEPSKVLSSIKSSRQGTGMLFVSGSEEYWLGTDDGDAIIIGKSWDRTWHGRRRGKLAVPKDQNDIEATTVPDPDPMTLLMVETIAAMRDQKPFIVEALEALQLKKDGKPPINPASITPVASNDSITIKPAVSSAPESIPPTIIPMVSSPANDRRDNWLKRRQAGFAVWLNDPEKGGGRLAAVQVLGTIALGAVFGGSATDMINHPGSFWHLFGSHGGGGGQSHDQLLASQSHGITSNHLPEVVGQAHGPAPSTGELAYTGPKHLNTLQSEAPQVPNQPHPSGSQIPKHGIDTFINKPGEAPETAIEHALQTHGYHHGEHAKFLAAQDWLHRRRESWQDAHYTLRHAKIHLTHHILKVIGKIKH